MICISKIIRFGPSSSLSMRFSLCGFRNADPLRAFLGEELLGWLRDFVEKTTLEDEHWSICSHG